MHSHVETQKERSQLTSILKKHIEFIPLKRGRVAENNSFKHKHKRNALFFISNFLLFGRSPGMHNHVQTEKERTQLNLIKKHITFIPLEGGLRTIAKR